MFNRALLCPHCGVHSASLEHAAHHLNTCSSMLISCPSDAPECCRFSHLHRNHHHQQDNKIGSSSSSPNSSPPSVVVPSWTSLKHSQHNSAQRQQHLLRRDQLKRHMNLECEGKKFSCLDCLKNDFSDFESWNEHVHPFCPSSTPPTCPLCREMIEKGNGETNEDSRLLLARHMLECAHKFLSIMSSQDMLSKPRTPIEAQQPVKIVQEIASPKFNQDMLTGGISFGSPLACLAPPFRQKTQLQQQVFPVPNSIHQLSTSVSNTLKTINIPSTSFKRSSSAASNASSSISTHHHNSNTTSLSIRRRSLRASQANQELHQKQQSPSTQRVSSKSLSLPSTIHNNDEEEDVSHVQDLGPWEDLKRSDGHDENAVRREHKLSQDHSFSKESQSFSSQRTNRLRKGETVGYCGGCDEEVLLEHHNHHDELEHEHEDVATHHEEEAENHHHYQHSSSSIQRNSLEYPSPSPRIDALVSRTLFSDPNNFTSSHNYPVQRNNLATKNTTPMTTTTTTTRVNFYTKTRKQSPFTGAKMYRNPYETTTNNASTKAKQQQQQHSLNTSSPVLITLKQNTNTNVVSRTATTPVSTKTTRQPTTRVAGTPVTSKGLKRTATNSSTGSQSQVQQQQNMAAKQLRSTPMASTHASRLLASSRVI